MNHLHGPDDGRLKATLMANSQRQTALIDGGHGRDHFGAMQRQRLFAKNMFARFSGQNHLRAVLGVRGAQDHTLDAWVGQRSGQIVQKVDTDLLSEGAAGTLIQITAGDQLQNGGCFDQP